ncbi:DUF3987 domain-containing protein [Pseudonocardia sp. WMMC193]|nr:DUF3987 domain-containing protein [Pseudonocardia sp. WMMC193]
MLLAERREPQRLRLSREADREVLDLERRLEPRLAPPADLAHMTDWASKLNGAIARLAGLLFLADVLPTGWGEPIPTRHLDAAARLGHYFLGHALAVFDEMAADPTVDDARAVLEWIARTGAGSFSRRDAFTGLSRSRFRKIGDLDPALQLLDDHGFIRPEEPPRPSGPGRRASPRWAAHPAAAETAETAETAE